MGKPLNDKARAVQRMRRVKAGDATRMPRARDKTLTRRAQRQAKKDRREL